MTEQIAFAFQIEDCIKFEIIYPIKFINVFTYLNYLVKWIILLPTILLVYFVYETFWEWKNEIKLVSVNRNIHHFCYSFNFFVLHKSTYVLKPLMLLIIRKTLNIKDGSLSYERRKILEWFSFKGNFSTNLIPNWKLL